MCALRLGGTASSWQRAVAQAERLVGYPTSFMSLRHLLSDEVAQVAVQLRRLVGTEHPLLKTARGLVGDQKRGSQTRGLVVLLLAKAVAPTGILPQHRSLAEIAETIHTAALIHRGIVAARVDPDMAFGNRLATLSGDFLLASASTGLAELNSTRVVALVSRSIGDIVEAEFSPVALAGDCLEQSCSFPALLEASRGLQPDEWEQYVGLSRGSLLASCARSAMILAEQSAEAEEAAAVFGDRWARLHCLREELALLADDQADGMTMEELYGLCPRPGLAQIHFAASGRPVEEFLTRDCAALASCQQRMKGLAAEAKEALDGGAFPKAEGLSALHQLVDSLVESA